MSHVTNRPLLVAAAAAVAAAGLMTNSVPGHASPYPLAPGGCNGYQFIDGNFVLNQSNGFRVEFPAHADAFANETATAFNNRQAVANTGHVGGFIDGTAVEFDIAWKGGPVGKYHGTVRDDLRVAGTTEDVTSGATASWESVTPLICAG